jgi:hypothetical protein
MPGSGSVTGLAAGAAAALSGAAVGEGVALFGAAAGEGVALSGSGPELPQPAATSASTRALTSAEPLRTGRRRDRELDAHRTTRANTARSVASTS